MSSVQALLYNSIFQGQIENVIITNKKNPKTKKNPKNPNKPCDFQAVA